MNNIDVICDNIIEHLRLQVTDRVRDAYPGTALRFNVKRLKRELTTLIHDYSSHG